MSKVLDLLNKLIQHQKSAEAIGSVAEAQAFAAKIQELMDVHKIEMSDVDFHVREVEEPFGFSEYSGPEAYSGGAGKRQLWTQRLATAVADANECDIILGSGNRFSFAGRTSNRELCVVVFKYLFELAVEMADKAVIRDKDQQQYEFQEWYAKYGYKDIGAGYRHWMKNYRKSWLNGFATSVQSRLRESTKARNAAATATGAMVHIRKDDIALRNWFDAVTSGPSWRHSKNQSSSGSNHGAYEAGKSAGSAVNLTPHNFGSRSPQRTHLLGGGQ